MSAESVTKTQGRKKTMPNGGGGYILSNTDYQVIDGGTLVQRGTYAGCIKVLLTHYWVSPPTSGNYWTLNTGAPDETIKKITSDVWSRCEDDGTFDWISSEEYWKDPVGGETYRWGYSGANVVLVEL
jgi:hypothetical protein